MKPIKDIGIVLTSLPFSETSIIIRVFLKDNGLVSFLIKGAVKKKNLSPSTYNPLSLIRVCYKPVIGGKLVNPLLIECISPLGFDLKTYHSSIIAQEVAVLVQKTWQPDLPEHSLFTSLIRTIKLLKNSDKNQGLWLYTWFVLNLFTLYGTLLEFERCSICERELLDCDAWFPRNAEGILGSCCLSLEQQKLSIRLDKDVLRHIRYVQSTGLAPDGDKAPPEEVRSVLETLILTHFQKNVHGLHEHKNWFNILK